MIARFLTRVQNILLRPRDEWRVIKEEQTTYGGIIGGYVAIIASIPPVMAVIERLTFNRRVVSNAVHSPILYVLAANAVWYCMIILNVIITGAVITAIVGGRQPEWVGTKGLKLAVYSFTPSFLVCILIVIPNLSWLIYGAIGYSIYLLYLGIRSLIGITQTRAAWYAVACVLIAGVIVGTLNTFEYMFESFLASKVFF